MEFHGWFLGASARTPGDGSVIGYLDIRKGFLGSVQSELSLQNRIRDSEKEVKCGSQKLAKSISLDRDPWDAMGLGMGEEAETTTVLIALGSPLRGRVFEVLMLIVEYKLRLLELSH